MQLRRIITVCSFATTLAFTGTAFAQDEGTPYGGDSTPTEEATTTSAPASTDASGGAFAYKAGTLGINTTFPTGGNGAAADIVYFLDPNAALDLSLGINLAVTGDSVDPITGQPVEDGTVFGLSIGAGYRMYKPLSGRIRPFLEPGVVLAIADFSEAGDTLALAAFATLGVELQVTDQFTLGTGVGGALSFEDSFETIRLGLNTASIFAGFYW